eukprot:CAMPEP_0176355674 /NCGR_PEP_ID=MMETSP0126-20121128/13458_1 /TAXON_ID=141414 ORGANISM="Strombidinopsis acuminatum, Strain SPMC142" /NCGR_SAMPLE_ID=MMETSP0126 /ASSEMBLY_ACC=CAM_ASM_000229 /LENGTH=57 /DNA_ID=CAMNT_0017708415 /DNA_START=596 /DNA_END=769 /DNA_ORIENTATION=-
MDKRILYKVTGRKGAYDKYSDDEDEDYKKLYLDPKNRIYSEFEEQADVELKLVRKQS